MTKKEEIRVYTTTRGYIIQKLKDTTRKTYVLKINQEDILKLDKVL